MKRKTVYLNFLVDISILNGGLWDYTVLITPSDVVQVERCTIGKLLCVPCPREYVDTSRQCCHCTYFMGLRKKPGVEVGEVIDIRVATQEFKEEIVNMFSFWTPGMEIHVSHVLKNQLPSYVFPDEYRKRSQSSKSINQQHQNKRKINSEMVDGKPSASGCMSGGMSNSSSQLKADMGSCKTGYKRRRLTPEEGFGEESKGLSVSESDGLAKEKGSSLLQNALLKEVEVSENFLWLSILMYLFGLFTNFCYSHFPCCVACESWSQGLVFAVGC